MWQVLSTPVPRGWCFSTSGLVGALLLLQGCTAKLEPGRTGEAPLPKLVARRVTGTVQREASRLVRLSTEHETLLATPEHPFATPGSGWVSAGRLVAGDWVVSEELGAVRLLSTRGELASRPVPVFNLSVASSHSYFVGTERVLVHNTRCRPESSAAPEESIEQLARERREINSEIANLMRWAPESPRIAELKARREKIRRRIKFLRWGKAQRSQRRAAPLADKERPLDRQGLLEDELDSLVQQPPSESRDARILHLTDQIATAKKLVEVRRQHARVRSQRNRAERRRNTVLAKGEDPGEFDKWIEHVGAKQHALRVQRVQLRVRERLLEGTPSTDARGAAVEARLRDLERQLAQGLGSEQQLSEQQLVDLERMLDATGPKQADLLEVVLHRADEVDQALGEREALMAQRRSPERATELESSYARLEQELRAERAAVEVAASALANEQAQIQRTQAGSSRGPTWQERLSAIQEEQVQLRAQWRAGLEARLDRARRLLRVRQGIFALRDQAIEVELGREIALLERELKKAS